MLDAGDCRGGWWLVRWAAGTYLPPQAMCVRRTVHASSLVTSGGLAGRPNAASAGSHSPLGQSAALESRARGVVGVVVGVGVGVRNTW